MLRRLLLAALLLVLPSVANAGTVAVLYFENKGQPQLEPLKVGLADMLVSDLVGTPGTQVVEREQLQAVLNELELGHSGKVDPATAAKIGKLLGAERFVMGSYFEMMGTLTIQARVVHTETGEIIHATAVNGATPDFFALEKKMAADLRAYLGGGAPPLTPAASTSPAGRGAPAPTPAPPAPAAPAVMGPDPKSVDAALAYSEGLMYLDSKDIPRARESFEKAVAARPDLEAAKAELAALEI